MCGKLVNFRIITVLVNNRFCQILKNGYFFVKETHSHTSFMKKCMFDQLSQVAEWVKSPDCCSKGCRFESQPELLEIFLHLLWFITVFGEMTKTVITHCIWLLAEMRNLFTGDYRSVTG